MTDQVHLTSAVQSEAAKTALSNRCDLCQNSRVSPGSEGVFPPLGIECPWCKSVRLHYGSYWQPAQPLAKRPTRPMPLVTTEDRLRAIVREELESAAHPSQASQRTGS